MTEITVAAGDSTADLDGIARFALKNEQGVSYLEFRRSLRPNRLRVGLDLALGAVALAATVWLAIEALDAFLRAWPVFIFLAAVSLGYWMAYLQLFIHEAAHSNLVADRVWNDRLANLLIGVWVGVRVENYRTIHWEHHRMHGEPTDTEHSYFFPLDGRFLVETLFGIKAVRVILFRRNRLAERAGDVGSAPATSGKSMLVCTAVLHTVVIASLFVSGYWPIAIAWAAGMGMFFPFFGALRQLLEHRSANASAGVDYSVTAHGRTTRMFREGLFGSTFGAAGFTRHLLHHWDPAVSYTNLAQVENFLSGCEPTRQIPLHRTTYLRAFLTLYNH